jgi:hypothetical protein
VARMNRATASAFPGRGAGPTTAGPTSITGAQPPQPRFGGIAIADQREVVVHPKARDANVANFPLFEMDRRRIELPKDSHCWPHSEALAWHESEVFDQFALEAPVIESEF